SIDQMRYFDAPGSQQPAWIPRLIKCQHAGDQRDLVLVHRQPGGRRLHAVDEYRGRWREHHIRSPVRRAPVSRTLLIPDSYLLHTLQRRASSTLQYVNAAGVITALGTEVAFGCNELINLQGRETCRSASRIHSGSASREADRADRDRSV